MQMKGGLGKSRGMTATSPRVDLGVFPMYLCIARQDKVNTTNGYAVAYIKIVV